MMRRFAPLLQQTAAQRLVTGLALVVAACGSRGEQIPVAKTSAPARLEPAVMAKVDPIVKGAPHGSEIVHVAVTEQADAALTADLSNSLRLWPSLDGTRTPLPIAFASEAAQLAITHAGRDLVAIVRDRAGTITVMRLGLDGSARGRVQLGGPEAAFDEVVTAGEHIVARTADHAVEWYTADGARRARLELEPGQRLTDLAARHGRIAAVIADRDGSLMRWITIANDTMRWDPALRLPVVPRDDMFAIAPNRRRIAFVDLASTALHVFDVDLIPTPVAGDSPHVNASHRGIGFIDDDTIGVSGHAVSWWATLPALDEATRDPWAVASTPPVPNIPNMVPLAAYADGALVTAAAGALVLVDASKARYLGWDLTATGGFVSSGDHIVLAQTGARFTWLDDDLLRVRSIDLQDHRPAAASWAYGAPVGSHHVISQAHFGDQESMLELINVDAPDKTKTTILGLGKIEQYFVGEGTLGVKIRNQLLRYKLDLVAGTAVEQLPKLKISEYSISFLRVFDPEQANGLVAVTVAWPHESSEHMALTYYRLENGKITKTRDKKFDAQILRALPNGDLVVLAREDGKPRIRVLRDGTIVREVARDLLTPPLAINSDVTRFAAREGADIVMFDDGGTELWRIPFWGASNVMFTRSDKRVIVAAPGGLVALDTATGAQVTRECGFEFGLHDKPAELGPHGFASVCEDPIVQ